MADDVASVTVMWIFTRAYQRQAHVFECAGHHPGSPRPERPQPALQILPCARSFVRLAGYDKVHHLLHPRRGTAPRVVVVPRHPLGAAAHVEIVTNILGKLKAVCHLLISTARSRRFQRGFHRVNMHRHTLGVAVTSTSHLPIRRPARSYTALSSRHRQKDH